MVWTNTQAVSVESRFVPLFPQVEAKGIVPFIYRVQTPGTFFVTTGDGVFIRSSITEPVY